MKARHRIGAIGMVLYCCVSCTLLQRVSSFNERYALKQQLANYRERAITQYIPVDSLRTLYPILKLQQTDAEELIARALALGDTTSLLGLAQIMGRGDLVLHYASSTNTPMRAEGYLLTGNYMAALELLRQEQTPPAPSLAMCLVLSGDAEAALPLLQELARSGPKSTRLNALRLLCQLQPESRVHRQRLSRVTPLDDERLYLSILNLKDTGPSSEELQHFARLLINTSKRGELWEQSAVELRPLLIEQDLFVQLYDLHNLLSTPAQAEYPYSLVKEYPNEIALLRAYESASTTTAEPLLDQTLSFRQKYGSATRAPNWALTYSTTRATQPLTPPSVEVYETIKNKLRTLLRMNRLDIDQQHTLREPLSLLQLR